MKILYIHNEYAQPSGEEHAAKEIVSLLQEHGHDVRLFVRSSAEINNNILGKIRALIAGIYNPCSAIKLDKLLKEYKPNVVQVQNLYPLISPSIFKTIRKRGIPIVMRCPNYRLFCPSGLSLNPNGEVCERCWEGNEINCIKFNCLGSKAKSIGYAARNAFARKFRLILDGVDVFIVQSEFQKQKFISQGIPEERIGILPGLSPQMKDVKSDDIGEWVSFVGRVSAEKGINEFIQAAQDNPDIPFKVAGNIDSSFKMPASLPSNIEFVGFKNGKDLDKFYEKSKIIVVPSKWYEGFPNVIIKGMLHKKPVITTNIGAMQSIINHGVNGRLISPGNATDLTNEIRDLYNDNNKCQQYGEAGFFKASTEYSRETIYNSLIGIYKHASELLERLH